MFVSAYVYECAIVDVQECMHPHTICGIMYTINHFILHIMCRRGTEEEYTELTQLLQDVSSYMGDVASLQKKVRDAKSVESKQKAKDMKAVMERLLSTSMFCGASVRRWFGSGMKCILVQCDISLHFIFLVVNFFFVYMYVYREEAPA